MINDNFNNFKNEMIKEFEKNFKNHGNSWKYTSFQKLIRFLENHLFKFRCNFKNTFNLNSTKKELLKLQNDLIDISNYCFMLFERIQSKINGFDIDKSKFYKNGKLSIMNLLTNKKEVKNKSELIIFVKYEKLERIIRYLIDYYDLSFNQFILYLTSFFKIIKRSK